MLLKPDAILHGKASQNGLVSGVLGGGGGGHQNGSTPDYQGGGGKKIPGTGVQLFFRGVPPEGEGGTKKKICANFFSGPQNLKFP